MTQLFFATPDYEPTPIDEKPKLVFSFEPKIAPLDPLPSGQDPAPVPRPKDRRPERLVLEAAWRKVAARILLNEPVADWPEGVFWLLALPAAAAGLGTGAVWLVAMVMGAGWPCSRSSSAWPSRSCSSRRSSRVGPWTAGPTSPSCRHTWRRPGRHSAASGRHHRPRVRTAGTGQRSAAHEDGHRRRPAGHRPRIALLPAVLRRPSAPDRQPGARRHHVRHRPRRQRRPGRTGRRRPARDVPGLLERGPAVGQPDPSLAAGPGRQGPDFGTGRGRQGPGRPHLSAGRFGFLDGKSEKGILESYLRAFGQAKRFIYLENQYFTDAIIADALAKVLKDKPGLELIFMLNIKPDVLLYPGRQARLVKQIRAAAPTRSASSPAGPTTRPTHDPGSPRSTCTPSWR